MHNMASCRSRAFFPSGWYSDNVAIAYFKHSHLNKQTQARPYMIVDHAKYLMRRSAALKVCSENMPHNYHAVLRFLTDWEDGLRKNGRMDKFIIAVPKEVTAEQAEKVLRQFGRRIGKGKAPFLFALHWDETNPHAHMVFLDRDPETGRRVFGTSELRSTDKLKFEWQDEANGFMNALGLDARIDFDAADREPANDNELLQDNEPDHAGDVTEMVQPPPPEPEPLDEPEAPDEGEDEMETGTIVYPQAEETISRDEWLGHLRATVDEMRAVDRKRREYHTAETQYKHWRQEAVKARESAREAFDKHNIAAKALFAAERDHEKTHIFGVKKGIKFLGFKTKGYKQAEEAESNLKSASYHAALLRQNLDEAENYKNIATARVAEYEDKLSNEERQMARIDKVYGKQMLFDEVERELKDTFAEQTKDLTPEHIFDMVNSGEISWAEAQEYLHFMGHDKLIAEYEVKRGRSL